METLQPECESEGPLATRHAMFAVWEPAKWALRHLADEGVSYRASYRYRESFVRFYLNKPHIIRFKTDWNRAFIAHCQRKAKWESEAHD